MGLAHTQRETKPREVTEGVDALLFLGEPVFEIECWRDGDQFLVRPTELDLVGIGGDYDDAIQRLGSLIEEYTAFLYKEGSDRTAAEQETLDLIVSRLAPALLKYHMRDFRTRLVNVLRHLVGAYVYWGAAPSKLVRSDRVLHV